MVISQPAIIQLEQRGNDLKVATLKHYIEAMGDTLGFDADQPKGSV